MTRLLIYLFLTLFLCGCTADQYVRQADRDVQSLIKDRERQTLDYTPNVDVPVPIVAAVPAKAYEKIPASPIPPRGSPPLEIEKVIVPRRPLGPELYLFISKYVQRSTTAQESESRYPRQPLGPPPPNDKTQQFDLFRALAYAVQHSRSYQNEMETLYAKALDVTSQRHLFAPIPFANSEVNYAGGQRTSDFKSALTVTNQAGINQKLPFGGNLTASGLVTFVNALHGNVEDGESAQLALSGAIPLLRGFGMVNLEPLISSERALVYAVRDFEEFRRSFVVEIASSYFNLLAAQQSIHNRQINLATSIDLRERSQALYDNARLSALEVQRARQQELQAQNNLINVEEQYQRLLDQFKLQLGMPVDEPLDVVNVQMQVNIPQLKSEDAAALALRYRLTLTTAADEMDDALRKVKNARNTLLPDLNISAAGVIGNEANTPAVAINSSTAGYSAGIRLDLPLDRLKERNDYRVALISFQKAQRTYAQTKDSITSEVREALRRLAGAEVTLAIQRVSIDLAQRRVEYANIRLLQGANSTRDVVEAQQDLLTAQDSYEQARSQLQNSVLEYMRVTGTLRLDPDSGTLGRVMDRQLQANNSTLRR